MKSAAELVAEAKKKHHIEETKADPAKKMSKPEENWEKCKEYLNSLPGNYMTLLQEAISKNLQMKSLKMGKNVITTITNWKHGYETMIEIVENENGATQKVTYYAFNNFTNTALIRAILGGSSK